jgi:hypothetical protein
LIRNEEKAGGRQWLRKSGKLVDTRITFTRTVRSSASTLIALDARMGSYVPIQAFSLLKW